MKSVLVIMPKFGGHELEILTADKYNLTVLSYDESKLVKRTPFFFIVYSAS